MARPGITDMCQEASFKRLQALTDFSTVVAPMESDTVEEHFAMDVSDMMKDMVKKALEKQLVPCSGMHKAEKLRIVLELEENGVFNVRGAVEHVASCLHVSIPTIYNYLKEIRGDNKSAASPEYSAQDRDFEQKLSKRETVQ